MTQDHELTPEQVESVLGPITPEAKEFFELTSTLANAVAQAAHFLSDLTGTDAVAWSAYLLRTGHMSAQEESIGHHVAKQMAAADEVRRLATEIPTEEALDSYFKLHCVPAKS